jgi:hypothetical protein
MKVFHVVFNEPIGPSWIAYTEPPKLNPNAEELMIKSWVEETDLKDFVKNFVDHVVMTREMGGGQPMHCTLEVRKAK